MQKTTATLTPLALKDAPALIETVFPAQKVSFEAQSERKAVAAQTLTGLGSYWKGRKPLILVRAIVLGSLLPPTENAEADLAVFEMIMAFDDESLARRALAANAFSVTQLQEMIPVADPERYFGARSWRRDITDDDKLELYRRALATFGSYEEKAVLGKRPEEVDQEWLYAPAWAAINQHYAHLGINASNVAELVEQLGVLRYGHRPRAGDTFSGGGSIPYEMARIGCDVYASDLNPIACMLTWGALHVIGADPDTRTQIEKMQLDALAAVNKKIDELGVETDENGNRAKAFLYCLEARCPETGWMIPLSPSWIISPKHYAVAKLIPDHNKKRFNIEVVTGASASEFSEASTGTIQGADMVYTLNGRTYRTPISTLRGDYRDADGNTRNRLRLWERSDFHPQPGDIFQERLYAIQWITKNSLNASRQVTYFSTVTEADFARERKVEKVVAENLARWQAEGLTPDMAIEPGYNTNQPIRERGWTHWQHLFGPRHLLINAFFTEQLRKDPRACLWLPNILDNNNRLCQWLPSQGGGLGGPKHLFVNQAFNTFWNYPVRATASYETLVFKPRLDRFTEVRTESHVFNLNASDVREHVEIFVTDPPYADAVNYHEVTEFFIAWLRKNPPKPFDEWVWDSRRVLAIKGSGEDFRGGMVSAYRAMTEHMPANGMQCVMFTHQDTGVWSDMIGIFWAAGLQVVAAWYIATETATGTKASGGYVQGTVILMLKKRAAGERTGFKQRLLPAVRQEVARQIETMMHLNDTVAAHHGEPVWGDSDLQMAGYAAALKVLTAYTRIGDEDVTTFALRPRVRGEVTVVDEIVQQAAETASGLLVPEGLTADSWGRLTGIERFVLRMMDIETAGVAKLDNYQNFAKAFRVTDYTRVMGDMRPNNARLKRVSEYASRDLTDATEIGLTRLGQLIIALQQLLKDTEAQVIVEQLRAEMADFLEVRSLLVDMLAFIERKATESEVRSAAEVLGARLKNLRFGD
jgi:putative DNA methylase